MPKPLDSVEVKQLVQIIASGAAGWGRALRDLRGMSGLSQEAVAKALDLSRTVVSHWEAERHRPGTDVLRNTLLVLKVDVRIVQEHLGGTVALDVNTDLQSAILKVSQALGSMQADDVERTEELLYDKYGSLIVAAQVAKALTGDRGAAEFVLARADRKREARRQRREWEPCPENAAFVRQPRVEFGDNTPFIPRAEEPAVLTTAVPVEAAPSAPRERREAPEPIEEKPTVSFDPPRGQPFVNDCRDRGDRPERVRRNGNTYRRIAHYGREDELLGNL